MGVICETATTPQNEQIGNSIAQLDRCGVLVF
jgi:hypothetical protein